MPIAQRKLIMCVCVCSCAHTGVRTWNLEQLLSRESARDLVGVHELAGRQAGQTRAIRRDAPVVVRPRRRRRRRVMLTLNGGELAISWPPPRS